MRVLVFISCLGLTLATDPFLEFVREHGRQYRSSAELQLRRTVFMENYDSMEEFTTIMGLGLPAYDNTTVFVDQADQAYLAKLAEVRTQAAPSSWSWRDQGGMSSVKNQAQCGSCAAFASVAVIETCFWQQRGVMFDDLSEQQLVDCALNHFYQDNEGNWGAFGCDGAWPPAYFDWIVKNNYGNIQTEASYPYTAKDGTCRCMGNCNGDFPNGVVTGMYNLWNTNEADMKELVYINPVTTSIQASWLGAGQQYQFSLGQHPAGQDVSCSPHCLLAAILESFVFMETNGQSAAVAAQYKLSGQQYQFSLGQHPAGHDVSCSPHCSLFTNFWAPLARAKRPKQAITANTFILRQFV